MIYPDGRQLDGTFDNLDRLLEHNGHGFAAIAAYQYIGTDRVAVLTYQNGTRLTYIANSGGQNVDVGYPGDKWIVSVRSATFRKKANGKWKKEWRERRCVSTKW